MDAEYPDDPVEISARQWETEGGRYGSRVYQYPDGSYFIQHWATRIEGRGTRVFGTLDAAKRYVNSRVDPPDDPMWFYRQQ